MKRRHYLALLGTIAVAGCTEGEPSGESTPAATPSETPASTSTPTSASTATASTETAIETQTETPESTPTDEDRARAHIEAAQEAIAAGVTAWNEQTGPDANLLAVTAESESFDPSPIFNAASDAPDELDEAESFEVEDIQRLIDSVRTEYELLRTCARVQVDTITIREDVDFATGRMGAGDRGGFEYQLNRWDDRLNSFKRSVGDCRILHDEMRIVDREYAGPFESKIDQFENEEAIYTEFTHMFDGADQAWQTLEEAREALNSGNYNTAQIEATDAQDEFEDVIDDADGLAGGTLSHTVDSWIGALESREEEAREIRQEAARRADDS